MKDCLMLLHQMNYPKTLTAFVTMTIGGNNVGKMKDLDIISQEKIELLNQRLNEAAMKRVGFRSAIPMIRMTLATIEGKKEEEVGVLIMSLFQVCSIERQIALVEQMKKLSADSMVNDVRDKCPELKEVLNERLNKKERLLCKQ